MNFELTDFYPMYPYINDDEISYDDKIQRTGENFFKDLFQKSEFSILGKDMETIQKGELFKQQKNVSRFMSGYAPYDTLLLFHTMGVGKTCASISIAEQLFENKNANIKGALIITKNKDLIKQFRTEIAYVCSLNKYATQLDKLSDRQLKKKLSSFYKFQTYSDFSKNKFKTDYKDYIIIIDEVHNLITDNVKQFLLEDVESTEDVEFNYNMERKDGEIEAAIVIEKEKTSKKDDEVAKYQEFEKFISGDIRKKVILLTGTPMKDNYEEILCILTLLIPGYKIDKTILTREDDFKNLVKGYISYLKLIPKVNKNYIGQGLQPIIKNIDTGENLNIPNIFSTHMTQDKKQYIDYQNEMVRVSKGSFQRKIRELSLISNPPYTDQDNLEYYSSKYHSIIQNIQENQNKVIFIYCHDFVSQSDDSEKWGGGAKFLQDLIRKKLGYRALQSKSSYDGLSGSNKYVALLTGDTENNMNLIRLINNKKNYNAGKIHVIIGSMAISEGISLANVQIIHVVTPWWNFSAIDQAISRGIRATSHDELLDKDIDFKNNPNVNIYLHASIYKKDDEINSIDLDMYTTSFEKDYFIKKIERWLKESSIDCGFNYSRNYINVLDGSRDCDYQRCKFICDGLGEPECNEDDTVCEYKRDIQDFSTDNLYYNIQNDNILIKKILEDLKEIHTRFQTIDNVVNKYERYYTKFQLIRCINKIINESVEVEDNYGIKGIITLNNNNFVFNDYGSKQFDTEIPILRNQINFNNFLQSQLTSFKSTITITDEDDILNIIIENMLDYSKKFLVVYDEKIKDNYKEHLIIDYTEDLGRFGSYKPDGSFTRRGIKKGIKCASWQSATAKEIFRELGIIKLKPEPRCQNFIKTLFEKGDLVILNELNENIDIKKFMELSDRIRTAVELLLKTHTPSIRNNHEMKNYLITDNIKETIFNKIKSSSQIKAPDSIPTGPPASIKGLQQLQGAPDSIPGGAPQPLQTELKQTGQEDEDLVKFCGYRQDGKPRFKGPHGKHCFIPEPKGDGCCSDFPDRCKWDPSSTPKCKPIN